MMAILRILEFKSQVPFRSRQKAALLLLYYVYRLRSVGFLEGDRAPVHHPAFPFPEAIRLWPQRWRADGGAYGSRSGLPSACWRRRYQVAMAAIEKTKMMLEMALISGVMPRRKRPQISSGRVLLRPMRKKLTAISSIERVKISRAAPMIDKRRLGRVTRQKV